MIGFTIVGYVVVTGAYFAAVMLLTVPPGGARGPEALLRAVIVCALLWLYAATCLL